jgi:hypothetical protein
MKQEFIEDNIIILSKQTIDMMLKQEHPSDLIGLYAFYYYTAKWQKTNIIKCSTNYVAEGLNWAKERVIKNKKVLLQLGLIENKKTKNEKGQITGWYIKLNYLWKKGTARKGIINNQRVAPPEGGLTHRVENPDTNALSVNSLNALSANKEYAKQSFASPSEKSPRKDQDVFDLIEMFSQFNPNYERFFSNKTQRAALERMLKKFGKEQLEKIVAILPEVLGRPYAPRITTPYVLEQRLADLFAYLKAEKGKRGQVFTIKPPKKNEN